MTTRRSFLRRVAAAAAIGLMARMPDLCGRVEKIPYRGMNGKDD